MQVMLVYKEDKNERNVRYRAAEINICVYLQSMDVIVKKCRLSALALNKPANHNKA